MNTFVMGDKGMEPCRHTRSDGKPALETRDNAVYCTTCGLAVLTVAMIRTMEAQLMGVNAQPKHFTLLSRIVKEDLGLE